VCLYCKTTFMVQPARIARGGGLYCSRDCYSKGKMLPIENRFWERVNKTKTCWIFTGTLNGIMGYGTISREGIQTPAHRVSWEIHNGPIPFGMWVLHKCDNPPCVNPEHLYLGTVTENTNDKVNRGRLLVGERVHNAKLTSGQVLSIRSRARSGESGSLIAKEFGMKRPYIRKVVTGERWKHLPL